jgi:molecular chaperone Hsp31 and glyoxalase 3
MALDSRHMPSTLCDKLEDKGVTIINKKADKTVCLDRRLITGASPLASNNLGKLAANTLLKELSV